MAGEDETVAVHQEINKWILDYLCSVTWKDFKESKQISNGERDLIQGMLCLMGNKSLCHQEKQLFLVMLCRLADGEDCNTRYSEGSDLTVLEDMLIRFETLIKMQTKVIRTEGQELVPVIKAEAVMVCCRASEFALGRKVCDRLWPKDDRKDKILVNMRELLRHRKTDHDYLKDYTYDNFIDTMLKYLDKVQEHFTPPLLVQAAENILRKSGSFSGVDNDLSSEEENQNNSARTRWRISSELLERSKENTEGKFKPPDRRLRKLWNSSTSKLFKGSVSPHKQTSSTPIKPGDSTSNGEGVQDSKEQEKTPKQKRASPDSQTPSESNKTPAKQRKTGDTADQDRPEPGTSKDCPSPMGKPTQLPPRYRKNINREDRHEPLNTSLGTDQSHDDDDDNISICSSTAGGLRKKWSQEEMENFYDAVKIFGVGKWAEVRDHLGTTRSSVQLKDKWRTMLKRGDVEEIKMKRKKKS